MLEIKPIADAKPEDIARLSDGTLVFWHQKPWIIKYHNAEIRWHGFPNEDEKELEAVPYLIVRDSAGETLRTSVVVLEDSSVKFVDPGREGIEYQTLWYEFKGGMQRAFGASREPQDPAIRAAKIIAQQNRIASLASIG